MGRLTVRTIGSCELELFKDDLVVVGLYRCGRIWRLGEDEIRLAWIALASISAQSA